MVADFNSKELGNLLEKSWNLSVQKIGNPVIKTLTDLSCLPSFIQFVLMTFCREFCGHEGFFCRKFVLR